MAADATVRPAVPARLARYLFDSGRQAMFPPRSAGGAVASVASVGVVFDVVVVTGESDRRPGACAARFQLSL